MCEPGCVCVKYWGPRLHLHQALNRGFLGNHSKRSEWSTAALLTLLGWALLCSPGAWQSWPQPGHWQTTDRTLLPGWHINSFTDTHSARDGWSNVRAWSLGHKDSGGAIKRIQSQLPLSNTTTHMPVNTAMSRAPSGTFSSPTHGVHHFLSNSPFLIVNTSVYN